MLRWETSAWIRSLKFFMDFDDSLIPLFHFDERFPKCDHPCNTEAIRPDNRRSPNLRNLVGNRASRWNVGTPFSNHLSARSPQGNVKKEQERECVSERKKNERSLLFVSFPQTKKRKHPFLSTLH
ncbi:hypothetical protein TNCV_1715851 [Trichonephila clavipes]|nr:hypothetical protein TNCV_1715851 [Trichonephila clavipes]